MPLPSHVMHKTGRKKSNEGIMKHGLTKQQKNCKINKNNKELY